MLTLVLIDSSADDRLDFEGIPVKVQLVATPTADLDWSRVLRNAVSSWICVMPATCRPLPGYFSWAQERLTAHDYWIPRKYRVAETGVTVSLIHGLTEAMCFRHDVLEDNYWHWGSLSAVSVLASRLSILKRYTEPEPELQPLLSRTEPRGRRTPSLDVDQRNPTAAIPHFWAQ